jgi:hypothetical protein
MLPPFAPDGGAGDREIAIYTEGARPAAEAIIIGGKRYRTRDLVQETLPPRDWAGRLID